MLELSKEIKQEIDHWIAKYPPGHKRSAVMAALRIVQENAPEHYLTPDAIEAIAHYLEMPVVGVQEVATFYSMYDLKPVGKHKINICTNISCKLRGSEEIVEHVCKKLNVKLGQTTADKKFTVKEVECLGACIGAPMFQIDKEYHEHLTNEKVDAILAKLE